MLKTVRCFVAMLPRPKRWKLVFLLLAMLATACLEIVNIAMLIPFLVVAADPSAIERSSRLGALYAEIGRPSVENFLLLLGSGALATLVLSNLAIVGMVHARSRFTASLEYDLSTRLLRGYLRRPYVFFLNRNAASLGMNVLSETQQVTRNFIDPGLEGVAWGVVATALIGLVVVVDPLVALSVALVLGGSYVVIYIFIRQRLTTIDRNRVTASRRRYKVVNEAFGSIKEAKILGREDSFLTQFEEPSRLLVHDFVLRSVLQKTPRYLLEILAFGGVVVIALVTIARQAQTTSVLPMLVLYAAVGFRLMPALQNAFNGLTRARSYLYAMTRLVEEYDEIGKESARPVVEDGPPLPLREYIALRDVLFTYPGAPAPVFSKLNMEIPAGTAVGIVGTTGVGKTTAVDIILGLLEPNSGHLIVDGVNIDSSNVRAWQRSIGYVPQHIYLCDISVASNIAFGIPSAEINLEAVRRAARAARIDEFVMKQLPDGYDTVVGERGVRLSGGQRQRIGIARALYHDPALLVLDEATSALDIATEAAVLDAIYDLDLPSGGRRTVILIAHRTESLDRCDDIIELRDDLALLRRSLGEASNSSAAAAR